ncbi:MAG: glycosyltransferase [Rhizobiaceae bacterium]
MQDRTAIERLRILELGAAPVVKSVFPGQTDFFSTFPRSDHAINALSIGLRQLYRRLRDDEVDLVVCQPPPFAFWHHQALVRLVFNRRLFAGGTRPQRGLGPPLLRLFRRPPVAVFDMEDYPHVDWWNHYLIDRATLYFKRELPADDWRIFTKTGTPGQPSARFRQSSRNRTRIGKLRPLPLGMPAHNEPLLPTRPSEKQYDVFFAGNVEGMPVRERGLAELRQLAAEGVRIDVPDRPIPREEFYARCARAWLTWSPEGYGWDCFRHYEAPACRSVPVHNFPPIRRHAPSLPGIHAFYHGLAPGELAATVRAALADKERLARMAEDAHAHWRAHHRVEAIARHVIESTMSAATAKG